MILLIDNYDSFSYNLYQLIGSFSCDITVKRNDEITVEEILKLSPSHIVLSPGPGVPKAAGILEELVERIHTVPILGVCLGHQAVCEVFGLTVRNARQIYHGKQDKIYLNPESRLFHGLKKEESVGRYHSLIAEGRSEALTVTAYNADKEIMAVEHKQYPIYGVQFHPESILTECGKQLLKNFLEVKYDEGISG